MQGTLDILRNYFWIDGSFLEKESLEDAAEKTTPESAKKASMPTKKRKISVAEVKELRKKMLYWIDLFLSTQGEDREEAERKRKEKEERAGGLGRSKGRERLREREKKAETLREIERATDFAYDKNVVLNGIQRDMRALFLYVQDIAEKDPWQLEDVLQLLFSFLLKDDAIYDSIFSGNDSKQHPHHQQHPQHLKIFYGENLLKVTGKAGINAFIGLLGCTADSTLRMWVLKVIAKLVECKKKQKMRSSFSPLPSAVVHRATVDHTLLSAMKFYLQVHTPFTPPLQTTSNKLTSFIPPPVECSYLAYLFLLDVVDAGR